MILAVVIAAFLIRGVVVGVFCSSCNALKMCVTVFVKSAAFNEDPAVNVALAVSTLVSLLTITSLLFNGAPVVELHTLLLIVPDELLPWPSPLSNLTVLVPEVL